MLELALSFKSASKLDVGVVSVRSVKPLDYQVIDGITSKAIFTLEENAIIGGFGYMVSAYVTDKNKDVIVKHFGASDHFVKNGSIESQLNSNGLSVENLLNVSEELTLKGEEV